MKKAVFLFHLILFTILNGYFFDVLGQNNIYHFKYEVHTTGTNTYGNPTEFITSNISSDYGKRKVTGNSSRWHRGVDFALGVQASSARYDHFLSLNTGTIKKLVGGQGYKYIITEGTTSGNQHNFGYGHIFDAAAANPVNVKGDLVLIIMDPPYDDDYAIIDLTNERAFGPQIGTATYNSVPFNVSTDIEQYEVLGNIGRSGATNYSYMHVHVYMFNNVYQATQDHNNIFNDRDPLQFISHINTTYDVEIQTDNNVNAQNVVTSSGTDAISFKVRYTMENAGMFGNKFSNAVMDIDNVDIYIKESNKPDENYTQWGNINSNYQLIMGEWVESHLSHGAKLSSEIYPVTADFGHPANPPSNTEINIAGNTYGDFNNTGIDPFAYWDDGNQPYDDYYFSDFYTRVIDNYQLGGYFTFANINSQAKYLDGSYNLYVKTETVRGNVYTSIDDGGDPTEIIIDNFLPYIEKVEIWKNTSSGDKIYEREWTWDGSNLDFTNNPYSGVLSLDDNIYIKITTSEPIQNINVNLFNNNYTFNSISGADDMEWEKTIPSNTTTGEHTLIIGGKDFAENDLSENPAILAIRQSDGSWVPNVATGTDQLHSFEIDNIVSASFTASTNQVMQGNSIIFINNSTGNPYLWEWTFEQGSPGFSASENPSPVFYGSDIEPGIYTVMLTIYGPGNNNVDIAEMEIEVVENNIPLSADFSSNIQSIPLGNTINFYDQSSGLPTTWSWEFEGGSPSVSYLQNPVNILYDEPGDYYVTLTVTKGFETDTETKTSFISVEENCNGNLFAAFSADLTSINTTDYVNFADESFGNPNYWHWIFEDGIPSESWEENPQYIYFPTWGLKDVTLEVSNNFGEDIVTYSNYISVFEEGTSADFTIEPEGNNCYTFNGEVWAPGGGFPLINWIIYLHDGTIYQTCNDQTSCYFCAPYEGFYTVTMDAYYGDIHVGMITKYLEVCTIDHCSNGYQDCDETAIDCGGLECGSCGSAPDCSDCLKNGNETGVDCGGSCEPCQYSCTHVTKHYYNTSDMPGVTHASDAIQAGEDGIAHVLDGQDVIFRAGNSITLKEGFKAEEGSHFLGQTTPCNCMPICASIPSVITPNDDGYNDELCISVVGAHHYEIVIKNCWNQEVYSGSGSIINNEETCIWDGSGQGSDGDYSYTLVLTSTCSGEERTYEGYILVLNGEDNNKFFLNIHNTTIKYLIYPNPNQGVFYIFLNDLQYQIDYEILNSIGEKVYFEENEYKEKLSVDISNYPDGIYFLKVYTKDKTFIEKIIKQ